LNLPLNSAIIPQLVRIKQKKMKPYEITYIITPSLTLEEAIDVHEGIKKEIQENKGTLGSEQNPIRKTLAYPINKNNEGYLASVDFVTDEESIKKIEEKARKEKNFLRYIVVGKRLSKKSEEERPKRRKTLKPEKAKLKEIDDKIDEIL